MLLRWGSETQKFSIAQVARGYIFTEAVVASESKTRGFAVRK